MARYHPPYGFYILVLILSMVGSVGVAVFFLLWGNTGGPGFCRWISLGAIFLMLGLYVVSHVVRGRRRQPERSTNRAKPVPFSRARLFRF